MVNSAALPFIGLTIVAMAAASGAIQSGSRATVAGLPEILANDNRQAAGTLYNGVHTIALVAASGTWYPESRDGPGHDVYAFGEDGKALWNPGPLLRVPAGTEIHATIRNAIAGTTLVVHGLHDRPGVATPVTVEAGALARVTFRLTVPGTYFYWGTTRGAGTMVARFGKDSQLMGALIVDPPGLPRNDHVFVIGIEDDSADEPANRRLRAAVVNGRSWPHGAMMTLRVGDTVRTRWINTSNRIHPIHLHGFYFRVDGRGDMSADTSYDATSYRMAVTELLRPGTTMSATWVPDRPGNWVMHCHMVEHMAPHLRGGRGAAHRVGKAQNHAIDVMSGLITGWRVLPREGESDADSTRDAEPVRRQLRLLVQSSPRRYGTQPGLGFVLQTGAEIPRADSIVIPGAPLVLTRGEAVQITVVNRLDEPTSIHWHGIELDSYYDGVSGFSGIGTRLAPQVEAQDSFAVRFTPPRAGTFIYHSHFDEERQLSSGMYGPLIVLEPGMRYDPETDRSWVLSQGGPGRPGHVVLNGTVDPIIDLEEGRTYRIRLININPNVPLTFSLLADSLPVRWRAVAKDGADLSAAQATVRPAVQQLGVGEAYDFELTPEQPGTLHLTARGPLGQLRLQGIARVRPRR